MDFSNLKKGLFNLKKPTETLADAPEAKPKPKMAYTDLGFDRAGKMNGSGISLKISLSKIFQDYKEEIRQNEEKQIEYKKPYLVKVQEHKGDIERLNAKLEKLKTTDIPEARKKLHAYRNELIGIRKNPDLHIGDKVGKASFYVGGIILLFLTVYLFIFYSSASYSAFFKQFSLNEIGVASSIFDGQALPKALKAGVTELILILTIPFVFLGLGYLIHKFQEAKHWIKYFKIASLVLVTFVFDAILAYEITEKIYNIKKENSFKDIPDFTVDLALQRVDFWLIIFAGFVVYIIWGFVFDFVMESYAKLDKVSMAIGAKKEEIQHAETELKNLEAQTDTITATIAQHNTDINKLNEIIHTTIIRPQECEGILLQFADGWFHWMNAAHKSKTELDEAHTIVNDFVRLNVTNSDYLKLNGQQQS